MAAFVPFDREFEELPLVLLFTAARSVSLFVEELLVPPPCADPALVWVPDVLLLLLFVVPVFVVLPVLALVSVLFVFVPDVVFPVVLLLFVFVSVLPLPVLLPEEELLLSLLFCAA